MTTIVNIAQPINLLERYNSYSVKMLKEKYSLTAMRIPKIEKIIITTTLGLSASDKNAIVVYKLIFSNPKFGTFE